MLLVNAREQYFTKAKYLAELTWKTNLRFNKNPVIAPAMKPMVEEVTGFCLNKETSRIRTKKCAAAEQQPENR